MRQITDPSQLIAGQVYRKGNICFFEFVALDEQNRILDNGYAAGDNISVNRNMFPFSTDIIHEATEKETAHFRKLRAGINKPPTTMKETSTQTSKEHHYEYY